jgi:hypothetical protein
MSSLPDLEGSRAYLQGAPVWSDNSLPSFHKAFLIPHNIPYLYDVARDAVLEYLHSLANSNTSCKQLDEVSCLDDHIRIKCLARGAHRHGTMYEIKLACYTLCDTS